MSESSPISSRASAGFASALLLLVVLACSQWDSPQDDADSRLLTSSADTATTTLDVTSIQVRVESGVPSARLMGRLPDGCTNVIGSESRREGSTFYVGLPTERSTGACETVGHSFEQFLTLSDSALVDGYYVIRVDGTTASAGFDVMNGSLRDTTLGPGWNAMPPDTLGGIAPPR